MAALPLLGGVPIRRVLAVDPGAAQLLVLGRFHDAARVAALPAHDLVGLAALVTPFFPAAGPAGVGGHRLALLLVPEERLAVAVALHAHVDGRKRGRPQLGRAQRFALVRAETLQ